MSEVKWEEKRKQWYHENGMSNEKQNTVDVRWKNVVFSKNS